MSRGVQGVENHVEKERMKMERKPRFRYGHG